MNFTGNKMHHGLKLHHSEASEPMRCGQQDEEAK